MQQLIADSFKKPRLLGTFLQKEEKYFPPSFAILPLLATRSCFLHSGNTPPNLHSRVGHCTGLPLELSRGSSYGHSSAR